MLPGGRVVKFAPKFVRPNWSPRGCLARRFMSEARGSGNVNIGCRAGADTASMAAEKSLGIATPKPIGCAKSKYFQTHFDPVRWPSVSAETVKNGGVGSDFGVVYASRENAAKSVFESLCGRVCGCGSEVGHTSRPIIGHGSEGPSGGGTLASNGELRACRDARSMNTSASFRFHE
jgi:hypothetical protein